MSSKRRLADAMADLMWLERNGAGGGVAAIIAERRRQVEQLGYDARHDRAEDHHEQGWLSQQAAMRMVMVNYMIQHDPQPGDAMPELSQAGALAAAEHDRMASAAEQARAARERTPS